MTIRPTGGPLKPVKSQRGHAAQETATAQRTLPFLGGCQQTQGTAQVARDLPLEAYDWSKACFDWQWADGWR
jgi:hypothetical protein